MRLFELRRNVDESGVSGTGIVAQGVVFDTGKCVLTWLTEYRSTTVYDSIYDVMAIHGHGGATKVVQFADIDQATVSGLIDNYSKDMMENVAVDFRAGNHRRVWDERSKLVEIFRHRELVDDRTAVDVMKESVDEDLRRK